MKLVQLEKCKHANSKKQFQKKKSLWKEKLNVVEKCGEGRHVLKM
jgi:hypothetical protein